MELTIENIGGLKRKHTFRFKKGLNFIVARNGRGASSVIDGLRVLIDPTSRAEVLFQGASRGAAALSVGGSEWHATVVRTKAGVVVSPCEEIKNEPPDLSSLAIVDAHHPLAFWNLSPENIVTFLSTISRADDLANDVAKLKDQVKTSESDLCELEDEVKRHPLTAYEALMKEAAEVGKKKVAIGEKLKEMDKPRTVARAMLKTIEKARSDRDFYVAQIAAMNETIAESTAKLKELKSKETPLNDEANAKIEELKGVEAKREVVGSRVSVFESVLKLSKINCPICSHLELSCGIERLPQNAVRKALLTALNVAMEEKQTYEKRMHELAEEIRVIKAEARATAASMADAAQNIRRCQSSRKDFMNKREEREQYLKVYVKELETSDKESTEYTRLQTEFEVLTERERALEEKRVDEFKAHENIRAANRRISELKKSLPGLRKDLNQKQKEFDQRVNAARELFNGAALEAMSKAGYLRLQSVQIDEEYNLRVQRKGLKDYQMLAALSTSEQVSVAVLMAAWGKKAYCPKFPFFAFDTISTAYTRGPLHAVLSTILDSSDYVIVTCPMDEAPEGIRIVQKIPG